MPSTKPSLNVNPNSSDVIIKRPKNPTASFDHIQQLINQVTSQNIETSNTALTKLDNMLLSSNVLLISIINYMRTICRQIMALCIFFSCRRDQRFYTKESYHHFFMPSLTNLIFYLNLMASTSLSVIRMYSICVSM